MIEIKKIVRNRVYGKHKNEFNKMVTFVAEFTASPIGVNDVELLEYEQHLADFDSDVLCDLIKHELSQDERTLEEWSNYLSELI